ncbi:swi/snf complex-related [Anaeramoeba flamelloides]|uniref:Swi/snf complex-related n=1 Tax=Anaeramoeba flamelloides TaxID=1746091 RepID=A0ABQ8Y4D5_9EUKA|nr:swi/snf complex-related [Anaeramoeba flamelloides]
MYANSSLIFFPNQNIKLENWGYMKEKKHLSSNGYNIMYEKKYTKNKYLQSIQRNNKNEFPNRWKSEYNIKKIISHNTILAKKAHTRIQKCLSTQKPIRKTYESIEQFPQYQNNIETANRKILVKAKLFHIIHKESNINLKLISKYKDLTKKWENVISLKEKARKKNLQNSDNLKDTSFDAEDQQNLDFRNSTSDHDQLSNKRVTVDLDSTSDKHVNFDSTAGDEYSSNYEDLQEGTIRNLQPMIVNARERKSQMFLDLNHSISSPVKQNILFKKSNCWTLEEKYLFLQAFKLFPKQFGRISQFLNNKSTKEVINFYYLNKKILNLKQIVQEWELEIGGEHDVDSGRSNGRKTEFKEDEINEEQKKNKYHIKQLISIDNGQKKKKKFQFKINKKDLIKIKKKINKEIVKQYRFPFEKKIKQYIDNIIIKNSELLNNNFTFNNYYQNINMYSPIQIVVESENNYIPFFNYHSQNGLTVNDEMKNQNIRLKNWNKKEISIFLKGINKYGANFKKISKLLKKKNPEQCKNYFQLYKMKKKRLIDNDKFSNNNSIQNNWQDLEKDLFFQCLELYGRNWWEFCKKSLNKTFLKLKMQLIDQSQDREQGQNQKQNQNQKQSSNLNRRQRKRQKEDQQKMKSKKYKMKKKKRKKNLNSYSQSPSSSHAGHRYRSGSGSGSSYHSYHHSPSSSRPRSRLRYRYNDDYYRKRKKKYKKKKKKQNK